MAFIAKLPTGQQLLVSLNVGQPVEYGPHLHVARSSDFVGLVDRRQAGNPLMLAHVDDDGAWGVVLSVLDPITVPYVNRFIAHTGSVVIKDWRTGDYRLKTRGTKSRAQRRRFASLTTMTPPSAPKPKPKPVAVNPNVEGYGINIEGDYNPAELVALTAKPEPEPSAAVITLVPEAVTGGDPIPGMVYPTGRKVTVKGTGSKGWTNMDGFIMRDDDVDTLNRAWTLRQKGRPAAVLITGPAGTAKTMMVEAFAASIGVPYLKVDCAPVRSVDDWSGGLKQDPATKTWAHRWSPFARALREGKPCVILLDELTRTESPAALNGLLGFLDETGSLLVPDANTTLRLPKGILVVATANIGPEFVGTLPLDGAVRQRFPYGVRMDYPTEALEAKLLCDRTGITRDLADSLVRMAVQQRKHRDDAQRFPSGGIISTRLLLSMADDMALGTTPRSAVWSVLRAQFDPADEAALTVIVDSQFPKQAAAPSAPEAPVEATITTGKHYWVGVNAADPCQYRFPSTSLGAHAGRICGFPRTDNIHLR